MLGQPQSGISRYNGVDPVLKPILCQGPQTPVQNDDGTFRFHAQSRRFDGGSNAFGCSSGSREGIVEIGLERDLFGDGWHSVVIAIDYQGHVSVAHFKSSMARYPRVSRTNSLRTSARAKAASATSSCTRFSTSSLVRECARPRFYMDVCISSHDSAASGRGKWRTSAVSFPWCSAKNSKKWPNWMLWSCSALGRPGVAMWLSMSDGEI